MSIRRKMILPLLLTVIVLGGASYGVVARQLDSLRAGFIESLVENKMAEIKAGLEASANAALEQAAVFSRLPEVQQAYELAGSGSIDDEADPKVQQAREALRVDMKPHLDGYSSIVGGRKLQLHFHLPNGRSLVRLWRAKQIKRGGQELDVSDDISSFRPTVLDVNKTGKPVKGVELGSGGFALRGVAPVTTPQGKRLGSVETLVEFAPIFARAASGKGQELMLFMNAEFLKITQELQDAAKFPLVGKDFVTVIGSKDKAVQALVDPDLLEKGKTGVAYASKGGLSLAAFPVTDYRDAQTGVAVLAFDASEEVGLIRGVSMTLLGVLLAVLVVPTLLTRGLFNRTISRPIDAIVAKIKDITEDRANLSDHLDETSQDEMGELARWFNRLMGKLSGVLSLNDAVLNAVPDPLFVVDDDHRILLANKATLALAGTTAEGIKGLSCADIFRTGVCGGGDCPITQRMRGVKPDMLIECQLGGQRHVIRPLVDKLVDGEGKVIGYLELAQDVTGMVVKEEEIARNLERMREVSGKVNEAAALIASTTEQVSAQVEQVAQGADSQRDRVGETAAAMEQMNATVLEVARNAGEASRQADETRTRAQEGSEIVNEAVAAIGAVKSLTGRLKDNMSSLGKRADDIGQVLEVISDIADQTNLLALNAAIEAARAGEAGRGFAVVADEVRKLAEKTMRATGEVGQSIKSIQAEARTSVAVTEDADKAVEGAASLADRSGKALHGILELVDRSAGQVQSIAAAAEEQSATSDEIHRAIEDVNRVASETSEGMAEFSKAMAELAQVVSKLRSLAANG